MRPSAKSVHLRLIHAGSGELIAEGPKGLAGIFVLEGNYYIRRRYLRTASFRTTWIPGLCPYKGLYVWLDYTQPGGGRERMAGWKYWLPNPLLFFLGFRPAVPMSSLRVEEYVPALEDRTG